VLRRQARAALVAQTNAIAEGLGEAFTGLSFVEGRIAEYPSLDLSPSPSASRGGQDATAGEAASSRFSAAPRVTGGKAAAAGLPPLPPAAPSSSSSSSRNMDVLIALHACDTATDDAIWYRTP